MGLTSSDGVPVRSTIGLSGDEAGDVTDQTPQNPEILQEDQVSPAHQTPQALEIIQALSNRHKDCQARQASNAPVALPGGLGAGLVVDQEHEVLRRENEAGPAKTPGNYTRKAENTIDWQDTELADAVLYQREQDALKKLKANQAWAAKAREALRVKREVVKAQKLEARKAQTRKASEVLATKRAKRSITS